MKLLLFPLCLFLCISLSCQAQSSAQNAGELVWHTDLAEARSLSEAGNKPIFGFFTGSDWCGWCRKIQNDVFAKPAFVEWANKNVVLLELDFPRRKQLPAALQQQNQTLKQAFNISGYPTIWMFYVTDDKSTKNLNLDALGSLGYPMGTEAGKEEVKFLSDANTILSTRKK